MLKYLDSRNDYRIWKAEYKGNELIKPKLKVFPRCFPHA
jgi:hypothetical protein